MISHLLRHSGKLIPLIVIVLLSSCANTRKAVYFDSVSDTTLTRIIDDLEPRIQKNDLLSITITSANPEATGIFNTATVNSTQTLNYTTTQATGFLVNQDGVIDLPTLGRIKAAGLTKTQLKDKITSTLIQDKLLLKPIVTIRYLNYKVTVLGEVANPAVLNIPDERISLFEALGMAGDMTVYSRRDNVMLVREEEGKRTIKRLNLNSRDFLSSPYYYLKSNDVVYVEPNRAKVSGASTTRAWLPAVLSGLSFAAIIIDRVTR